MQDRWPPTPLGNILEAVVRRVSTELTTEYRLLGVRLEGEGPFLRETKLGSQISANSLNEVKTGDFIYSRLFAWRGAFGIINDELDGCYVSNEFPLFRPIKDQIDIRFLNYWFRLRSVINKVEAECSGSTPLTRNRYKEEFFLRLEIPLPPLSEQQRIVAKIEQLAAKIEEANRLRRLTIEETEILQNRVIDVIIGKTTSNRQPLEQLLAEPLMNGLSLPASKINRDTGVLFAKVGVVNTGIFNPLETKQVDIDLSSESPYWLRFGDIVVSRGNTTELVGRAAVYTGTPPKCAIPDLLIRIRLIQERTDPMFIAIFFRSCEARDYIESQVTGTSPTMKKISQPKLRAMLVPVMNIQEQRRIVAYLGSLQAQVDRLKALQAQTAAELEALLPSILDRAFKGEL